MGLQTVLWKYDSNDWRAGVEGGVSSDIVDANYEMLLKESDRGIFDKVRIFPLMARISEFIHVGWRHSFGP